MNVGGGTFREQSPRAWDALIRTNLTHVFHATPRAIPEIKLSRRGGSITNITTIEGYRAAPDFAVYSAAKAAVAHFARTMAVELAPDRIRVNSVAPDITPTPGMMGIGGGGPRTMVHPLNVQVSIPMGRVGVPSDISNTMASSGWFNWPGDGYGNTLPASVLDLIRPVGDS